MVTVLLWRHQYKVIFLSFEKIHLVHGMFGFACLDRCYLLQGLQHNACSVVTPSTLVAPSMMQIIFLRFLSGCFRSHLDFKCYNFEVHKFHFAPQYVHGRHNKITYILCRYPTLLQSSASLCDDSVIVWAPASEVQGWSRWAVARHAMCAPAIQRQWYH